MITYYDPSLTYMSTRLHPYDAGAPGQSGYVDFKSHPEKIETLLEDFVPHAGQIGVRAFYNLLRYVNSPQSHLESCDCGMLSPSPNTDSNSTHIIRINGRLFLMYRDERLNCSKEHYEWLCGRLMAVLNDIDSELAANEAVLGFTLNPVLHLSLSTTGQWLSDGSFECDDEDPAYGKHTMITFWSYGESAADAFENLARTFSNLQQACEMLDTEINAAVAGL